MANNRSPFQTRAVKSSGLSPLKENGEEFNSEIAEKVRLEAIKYISEDIYKSKLSENNSDLSEKEIDTIINNRLERVKNAKIYLAEESGNQGGAYAENGNLYITENSTASTIGHEFGHIAGGSFFMGKPGDEFTLSANDIATLGEDNVRAKQFYETGKMSVLIGGGITDLEGEEVGSAITRYIQGSIDPKTGLINTEKWGPLSPVEVSEDGTMGKAINPSHAYSRHTAYIPENYANMFDLQLSLRRAGVLGENEEVTIDHLKQLRNESKSYTEQGAIDNLINTYGKKGSVDKLNTVADAQDSIDNQLYNDSALTMRINPRTGLQ